MKGRHFKLPGKFQFCTGCKDGRSNVRVFMTFIFYTYGWWKFSRTLLQELSCTSLSNRQLHFRLSNRLSKVCYYLTDVTLAILSSARHSSLKHSISLRRWPHQITRTLYHWLRTSEGRWSGVILLKVQLVLLGPCATTSQPWQAVNPFSSAIAASHQLPVLAS